MSNDKSNKKKVEKIEKPLVEGVDFEWNADGLMVLSKNYLLKRGYCCGNKCANCPYINK